MSEITESVKSTRVLGVTEFNSEMKRVEKYPDFKKLAQETREGLKVFWLEILTSSQRRQAIL